jgi:hypothetical protein
LQGVLKGMLDRVRSSIHATHFTRSASINASASRSNLAAAGANNGGGAVTPGSWLCWSSFLWGFESSLIVHVSQRLAYETDALSCGLFSYY